MPETTISKKDYVQDCVFKDFEVRASPGISGTVKDIIEDIIKDEQDEQGIAVCKLLRGEKKRQCVRGMCPLFLAYKTVSELKQGLQDQKKEVSIQKTRLDKLDEKITGTRAI